MSAEVIAGELGLDLYTVDLATVVDKYVGETEKNLERIFTEAAGVNGVLLFDEADAVFGKRSEVRDAHDRYANIESAYLLQRMETFDGLAILSTNLRANIDEAFTRRLDVHHRLPDAGRGAAAAAVGRAASARRCRSATTSTWTFCAAAFELTGGNIRSAAITAAYLAAEAGPPGRHDGADRGRRAGVPQARPAGAGTRVRPLPRAAPSVIGPPRSVSADPLTLSFTTEIDVGSSDD